MLDKTDWAHLIPHAGAMCLLDGVTAWDEASLDAVSESFADAKNPLRGPAGLHAVHLVEYAAQATAVHGALLARQRGATAPRPGRLVSVREVVLAVEYVDAQAGRLDVQVRCLHADEVGAQYAFTVSQGGEVLASGRTAVIHPAS